MERLELQTEIEIFGLLAQLIILLQVSGLALMKTKNQNYPVEMQHIYGKNLYLKFIILKTKKISYLFL